MADIFQNQWQKPNNRSKCSENTKHNKDQRDLQLSIAYSNYRKSKPKENFFKEARGGKSLTYRATRIWITSDFSSKNQASKKRLNWNAYSVERKNKYQPTILYPEVKLSFKSEGKYFLRQKLREFVNSKRVKC